MLINKEVKQTIVRPT